MLKEFKPDHRPDYSAKMEHFDVISSLRIQADHYRLQDFIHHTELVKANKALIKRARQVKVLRAKVAHYENGFKLKGA